MGQVSKEQITKAKELTALDYILRDEVNHYKLIGNTYRSKEHPSLAVNEKGFYWHSQGIGGKSALDYLIHVRRYSFTSAVEYLTDTVSVTTQRKLPSSISSSHTPKSSVNNSSSAQHKQDSLVLPQPHINNYRVIAYLQSRGINRNLIDNCIQKGTLYQANHYNNAVFVGVNKDNKPKFAAVRSIYDRFIYDVKNSDKRYGFTLPPVDKSNALILLESPIDTLSYQTLLLENLSPLPDGHKIALGGTSLLALEYFLEHNPSINSIIVATDNDDNGSKVYGRVVELLDSRKNISLQRLPPPQGNDWNDTLRYIREQMREKNAPTAKDMNPLHELR